MCHSRRNMKRDESKETYKLPHRLIEKKRRDRINECIAQLKDLLPEHLKLTTLGHLEKAVVLELTLKHVKALTVLTEQQHQKIVALQNGDRSLKSPPPSDLEAFHSGFQTCTKEVLHYLSRAENGTASCEQRCIELLAHLHSVCARFLPGSPLWIPKLCGRPQGRCCPQEGQQQCPGRSPKQERPQPHCVPVIQRTDTFGRSTATPHRPPSGPEQAGEPDTDTDSGYGGEGEGKTHQAIWRVKREPTGDGEEEAPEGAKRRRRENGSPSGALGQGTGVLGSPESSLLHPLMALGLGATGGLLGGSLSGQAVATPFCLPFYFIAPSMADMQPLLERISLEKSLYPTRGASGPLPFFYPAIPIQGLATSAAALPSLALATAEKGSSLSGAAVSCFPGEGTPTAQPPPRLSTHKLAGLNTDMESCPAPKQALQPSRGKPLQKEPLRSSI
ncbi:class E basic helix-loop-helix protein 41 isoform X2 [Erythrolamprus reginae]